MKISSMSALGRALPVIALIAAGGLETRELFAEQNSQVYIDLFDDECCSDPGQIAECWWQDAQRDSAICFSNSDCLNGNICDDDTIGPGGEGLCTCDGDEDCEPGVCLDGVCGPSYCNGILACSCWGGCEPQDLGPYSNPNQMCQDADNGFPGFCCDGNYPKNTEGDIPGYCSNNAACSGGCSADEECNDGNPCTDDLCADGTCLNVDSPNGASCESLGALPPTLSVDCTDWRCESGACSLFYTDDGSECSDNILPPEAPEGWHEDCWFNGCTSGRCMVTQRSDDYPCDDDNTCSSASECGGSSLCMATIPVSPPEGDCCDDAIEESYADTNSCTADWCDDTFHDQHIGKPEFTACVNPLDEDDTCGAWQCNASAQCAEMTAPFIGLDCHSAASGGPGPGGDATFCLGWTCSDQLGEEGQCVSSARNQGLGCGWSSPPDTCGSKTCQSGICNYNVPAGTTPCTPQTGPIDPCCDYECNSSHQCVEAECAVPEIEFEQCDGEWMGTLSTTLGSTLTTSADNKCTSDDYDVMTTGIFDECDLPDQGENVHYFYETTHSTAYLLRHTLVDVDTGGEWDPLIYTSVSCHDTGAGPEIQPDQYTCNAGSSITSGPWPLVDKPTSSVGSGYTTTSQHKTWAFVDSRNTTSPAGGEYDLDLTVQSHSNNSCDNTASQVSAPRIDGGGNWKERWRGTIDSYVNYLDIKGGDLSGYCWDGGSTDANDPKTAFFRVDLPDGAQTMTTGTTTWDHNYKIYTDHNAIVKIPTVLSWWGSNPPDGDCASSLSNMQACKNPPTDAPREIIIRNGDLLRSGFAMISNADDNDHGDYELNVLRVPRKFLGMSQLFAGTGSGMGCGCGQQEGTTSPFNLAGYRLDFIPINDDVGGYAVRKTYVGNSWLVEEGTVLCEGIECSNPSDTEPLDMEFQFPFAGDFYSKFCVDAAGRIELAKNTGDCVHKWDPKPDTIEFHETGAPSIAALWGSIIPCQKMTYSTCGRWGWGSDGDLDCASGLCFWYAGSCDVWKWDESGCQITGKIKTKLTVFEGTTAMVVTWEGFDGYMNPKNDGPNPALEFQVIMRVDGRITLFYKETGEETLWNEILDANGWMVGLSGGRSALCDSDDDCNSAFDTTGLSCDTGDPVTVSGEVVWEPKDRCTNPINFQQGGDVQVSGSWQGE
jgi:hypothetical protein